MKNASAVRLALILMGAGCSPSVPNDALESPPVLEWTTALPVPEKDDSVGLCSEEGIPESELRGYEPSLAAWVNVADTIFVGTVSTVEQIESPAYLRYVDEQGTHFDPIDIADCDANSIIYGIRIRFEQVEVLHGDAVGPTLSIEMGRGHAEVYPGIMFDRTAGYPTDLHGNRVYLSYCQKLGI